MEELESILSDDILKIVISNKSNKEIEFNKIHINIKESKGKKFYQIEKFTDKQAFHENIEVEELNEKVIELFNDFKNLNAWSEDFTYDMKISKKGKVFLNKSKNKQKTVIDINHNKEKKYILKEGEIIEPLIDLGVFTKDGKIVKSQYDKYKQINRFIEMVDDEIKKNELEELTVLDFGCGKSYLTFVLYHYFVKIKNLKVKMIGLDLKKDVIKKCNEIAKKYNYENLSFEIGDINGYKFTNNVDMVITLHACDTATDYALFNAINWNTKMIFSVPCCQHELNKNIKTDDFSLLTKYGIIKERVSSLMTDAIRSNLLEYMGYKTQILEFIDISHSPKNLLIRASKSNISDSKKKKSLEEVEKIINEFGVSQTLYNLLKENNHIK